MQSVAINKLLTDVVLARDIPKFKEKGELKYPLLNIRKLTSNFRTEFYV